MEDGLLRIGDYFEREVKIDGLKYKRSLYMDYYITEYDLYIEYDGKQHFIYQEGFHDYNVFRDSQIRDRIKNNFFIDNKLNLLRLDKTNFSHIDEILKLFKDESSIL